MSSSRARQRGGTLAGGVKLVRFRRVSLSTRYRFRYDLQFIEHSHQIWQQTHQGLRQLTYEQIEDLIPSAGGGGWKKAVFHENPNVSSIIPRLGLSSDFVVLHRIFAGR
ncbi:uncharacterized protein J3R85_015703 [Psidium guajava]|nr:uncharacterized protein J3R85_015703 [Psidium guajava]